MTLEESVGEFIEEKRSYFEQWIYNEPIIISKSHNIKLERLQKIMYKLIQEFVTNYSKYKHLMPVEENIENIIRVFNEKKFKIGSYRTDFVYNQENDVKIIEITCRFALNGMFLSALMNEIALDYKEKHLEKTEVQNPYHNIYKHLNEYIKDTNSVCILKGADTKNESKIYTDIFERMGMTVTQIKPNDLEQYKELLSDSFVISELSFDEITAISQENIRFLSKLNLINDFRTIFLIHDKRFFSVIGKKELQENALTAAEISEFEDFYIPTYTATENPEIWNHAKLNKDEWILKHRALGKSQKIYAGLVTEPQEWKSLFTDSDLKDLVLQKWIPQKRIFGKIKEEKFEDYVTGTLLFFDDNYYGFGDFRTSSHPVTNKVDHRKLTSLIITNDCRPEKIINYIN